MLRVTNQRRPAIASFVLIACFLLLVIAKPSDNGQAYTPYFAALNAALQTEGVFKPTLVLDADALDTNIALLRKTIPETIGFRVVAKSLPSIPLLEHIMRAAETNKLMVFHVPFALQVVAAFDSVDLLFGKPMPVAAARQYYQAVTHEAFGNTYGYGQPTTARSVQWLIDSKDRLMQYQQLAHELEVVLQINIEIDVGLHRGGLATATQIDPLLRIISQDPLLEFSGFMGYDAHVAAAPPVISSQRKALRKVQQSYQSFIARTQRLFPELWTDEFTRNGAGSKTYMLYVDDQILNDISVGSALVKPTDYDVPQLVGHTPAIFIATPVLKRLEGTHLPYLEVFSNILSWWNPNLELTYFMYGGGWLAKSTSPEGLVENPVYGFSTNQAIIHGSLATTLQPDDFIFLRPTQSEKVMREFGAIKVIRNNQFVGTWDVFVE